MGCCCKKCCRCCNKRKKVTLGGNEQNYREVSIVTGFSQKPSAISQENEEKPIQEKKEDEKNPPCCICGKESMFELNCGCKYCTEDSSNYYDMIKSIAIYEEYTKCKNCKKEIKMIKYIKPLCGICLENKSKIFRFPCSCNNEVCEKCYKKCIIIGRCPFCNKKFEQIKR